MLSLPFQIQIGRQKKVVRIQSLNWDLWICFQVPISCRSFPTQGQLVPSCSSCYCVLRIHVGWAPPKYGCTEMWAHFICSLGPNVAASSEGTAFLFIFGSDSETWEQSILCIFSGDSFYFQGVAHYCQEYLFLPTKTRLDMLKDFHFKLALWSEVDKMGSWFSEPEGLLP